MDEHLPCKLHTDVYKIDTPQTDRLFRAKLSIQAFALGITADDPFVIIGDTIYALSEEEFYASRAVLPIDSFVEAAFKTVLGMDDLTIMRKEDQDFVQNVKNVLPTCPSCKYNKYKNAIYKLVKKYNIPVVGYDRIVDIHTAEYPHTTAPVASTVSTLIKDLFTLPAVDRRACVDCVTKHISQAYILGNEALLGYPEHLELMCGHLGEALAEMPKEADVLTRTLRFCLARTVYTRKPFLPIFAILPMLNVVRQSVMLEDVDDTAMDTPPATMEVDFTDAMMQEIDQLSDSERTLLWDRLNTAQFYTNEYKISPSADKRTSYLGAMACAADAIAANANALANMLRNRRLLFSADPPVADEAGYGLQEILDYLRK